MERELKVDTFDKLEGFDGIEEEEDGRERVVSEESDVRGVDEDEDEGERKVAEPGVPD